MAMYFGALQKKVENLPEYGRKTLRETHVEEVD